MGSFYDIDWGNFVDKWWFPLEKWWEGHWLIYGMLENLIHGRGIVPVFLHAIKVLGGLFIYVSFLVPWKFPRHWLNETKIYSWIYKTILKPCGTCWGTVRDRIFYEFVGDIKYQYCDKMSDTVLSFSLNNCL